MEAADNRLPGQDSGHSVKNNGHAWPGGQPGRQGAAVPTTAFDATEEMWAFFTRHRINAN